MDRAHTDSGRAALRLAAAGAILGTLGVFVLEAGLDSVSVVFWRCLIGAVAMAAIGAATGAFARLPNRRELGLAALTGVLMVGNWLLFFEAIRLSGIADATIAFHVQPVLVLLFAALFFGARLRARDLGWSLLAFAGLGLAIGVTGGVRDGYLLGVGAAVSGAVLYAWVTLIARSLGGMNPYLLTLVQCLVGALLLALANPLGPQSIAVGQWGWLIGLGIIHTGLVYVLIYGALPRLAPGTIAVLLYVYPASAIIVDFIVYGRLIGPIQAFGLLLILIAGFAVTSGPPLSAAVSTPARRPR